MLAGFSDWSLVDMYKCMYEHLSAFDHWNVCVLPHLAAGEALQRELTGPYVRSHAHTLTHDSSSRHPEVSSGVSPVTPTARKRGGLDAGGDVENT